VTGRELRDALAELAREAGLDVRVTSGSREVEPGILIQSGVCRVRGVWWVVLAGDDPPEAHVALLAGALRDHAADFLANRYLAPAVREALEPPAPEGGR
jgi:hypothetical protein